MARARSSRAAAAVSLCALLGAVGAGCVASGVRRCEDGTLCPAGTVCAPTGCVSEAQVAACFGRAEGTACTLPGEESGRCQGGACVSVRCGNGRLEPGELCDDGNTQSGDGSPSTAPTWRSAATAW